ncbi:MAG: phage shock protein PspA [Maricaulaceae bacterium]
MGIFSRLGDIINSNLNSMLESAENPEKLARLAIQEMEDTLIEVRSAAARAIADKKELSRKLDSHRDAATEWETKAELAIQKGREDLARGALTAKQKAAAAADTVERQLGVVEDAIDKAEADMAKLQGKLDEAKAKHKALMMRRDTAERRLKTREKLADSKVDDALTRYAVVERKVDEIEAQVEAYDLNNGKSLTQQFEDLAAQEAVEKELAELKARTQTGANPSA